MEKVDRLVRVLDFYVKADKLKEKRISKQFDYSIASHMFGSMILATAIDSEFEVPGNLTRIYRKIFFYNFFITNPDYDIDELSMADTIKSEIGYLFDPEFKLASLYENLDVELTKLISVSKCLSESDLVFLGSCVIGSALDKPPIECEEIFKFYLTTSRLKNKERSGWDDKHWNIKTKKRETVADHVIGTLSLALGLNSEFPHNLDIDKVLKTLVLHEIGEAVIGDITPFDGITPEEKAEMEHKAMITVLGNLKEKESMFSLLCEFDGQETTEAYYAYLCDKDDPDIKAKIYQDGRKQHSLKDQANNITFMNPRIREMIKNGAKTAFDIWFEWDKSKFEGNEEFPEFMELLRFAKYNNILHLDELDVIRDKVHLSDSEHSFLLHEISDVVSELYDDDNVDAVYMIGSQENDIAKGILTVRVVLEDGVDSYYYERLIDRVTASIDSRNTSGVFVKFDYDYANKYNPPVIDAYDGYRVEQLCESTILFDKSGVITSVRGIAKEYDHLRQLYLVDYVPPIDKAVVKSLNRRVRKSKKKSSDEVQEKNNI